MHLSSLLRRRRRRRPRRWRRPSCYDDARHRARARRPRSSRIDRDARDRDHRRRRGASPTTRCVLATGSCPFVPPIPGTDAAGVFVYRTIDDLEAIRAWAAGRRTRRRRRRRPARARGGQRPAPARPRDARRRVRAAADGRAARRRRRPRAAPRSRGARRRTCTPAPPPPRCAPTTTAGSPGWRSPTATDARRRPGRVLRRHPARATSWPARPASTSASAAASSSTTRCAHVATRRLRHRRVRLPRRPRLRPRRARLRAWPRSSPTGSPAATRAFTGADTVHQAQAAGRRRRQLRRRVRRRDGAAGRSSFDDPRRRRLQEARRRPPTARACSAASSSATPPPTARSLAAWRAATCRRPTPRATCSSAGATATPAGRRRDLPDDGHVCSCNNVTKGAICARHRATELRTTSAPSRRAPRPAPAAAAACPLVTDLLDARAARRPGVDGRQRPLRALRLQPPGAVRPRARAPASRTFAELLASHGTRPRLRDLQAGGGLDPRLAWQRATSSTASRPALQDTNDHFLANIQRDGTYSVVPRVPGGEITPDAADRHRRGRQATSASTPRSPAASASTCSARAVDQLPDDLGAAGRRRLRVGPRLRQGAAHGEVLRRHDLVPLRRAGLGRHGHPPRAALPGPARAAQAQVGRVGLRPRVRRGPEQGLRRHRHREGLEPLRRRQRRHAPAARRAARRGPRRRRR